MYVFLFVIMHGMNNAQFTSQCSPGPTTVPCSEPNESCSQPANISVGVQTNSLELRGYSVYRQVSTAKSLRPLPPPTHKMCGSGMAWKGLIWLRTGTVGGALVNAIMNLRVQKYVGYFSTS